MKIYFTAVLACVSASFMGYAYAAEPYQYGNLTVAMDSEWSATPLNSPGMTVVTFDREHDTATPKATLVWLESTPLGDASPKDLVHAIAEAIGVQAGVRHVESGDHNVHRLVASATIDKTQVRTSLYGYRDAGKLYLLAFVATPSAFTVMNGEQQPLTFFKDARLHFDQDRAERWVLPAPTVVLARSGSDKLTQQVVNDTLAMADFLAATTISVAEKKRLRQTMIDEYPASTDEERQTYRQISMLMEQLVSVSAVRRAEIRRDMLAQIWFDSTTTDEETPLVDVILKYNPILGADEKLGLAAPRSALDSLLNSNSFVATRAGLPPLTRAERDQLAEEIRSTYDRMNERQKRYLADGEVNWLKLISVWPSWNPAEQEKHLGVVGIRKVESYAEVPQVARNLEHWAGIARTAQLAQQIVEMQSVEYANQHLRGLLGKQ